MHANSAPRDTVKCPMTGSLELMNECCPNTCAWEQQELSRRNNCLLISTDLGVYIKYYLIKYYLIASRSTDIGERSALYRELRHLGFVHFVYTSPHIHSFHIGNVELMHGCFPKHSCMGTARIK